MSSFINENDNKIIENLVQREWQSYSGLVFESLAGILLMNRFSPEYEMTGGWWNSRGDEVDFIALAGSGIPVAIEVKNRHMDAN